MALAIALVVAEPARWGTDASGVPCPQPLTAIKCPKPRKRGADLNGAGEISDNSFNIYAVAVNSTDVDVAVGTGISGLVSLNYAAANDIAAIVAAGRDVPVIINGTDTVDDSEALRINVRRRCWRIA